MPKGGVEMNVKEEEVTNRDTNPSKTI